MKAINRLLPKLDYRGINMVDLMMWLVIAALLLATALQSIGYYQKSAHMYQMKAEADVVASRVMASLSDRGTIDGTVIDAVVAEENAARNTDSIEVSWGAVNATAAPAPQEDYGFSLASAVTATSSSQAYYLKVTDESVKDADVVYFLEDTASHSAGVNVLAKDALGADAGPPAGAAIAGKCYTGQWKTSYFNAFAFGGSLVAEECANGGASFNHQFGDGKPHPAVPADYFSVRWEKDINITKSGNYTFTARGDDQVWVYLDGVQIINAVYTDGTKSVTVNVPAGTHKLKVEMNDGVRNAYTQFSYAPTP
jgi:Tfp pilus assembly protein PilE